MQRTIKQADESTPLKEEYSLKQNESFIQKHLEISFFILCFLTILSMLQVPFALLFTTLSHSVSNTPYFTKGFNDIFRTTFWFLCFILIRSFLTSKVLLPIGVHFGIPKYSNLMSKFQQQSLLMVYYTISWSIGMYLLNQSPYGFQFPKLWGSYPYTQFTRSFKEYYLGQLGFWFSEFYFVHIEPKRKDHLNMLIHHLITISLIITSFLGNFTPFGHVILVMMDLPDVLLTSAKVMNYLKFQMITDVLFGVFALVWLLLRHFAFIYLLYVIAFDPLHLRIPMECNPAKGIYLNWYMLSMFLALLIGLQVLMIIWFTMICKIITKVLSGAKPEDIRSDDEE